MPARKRRKVTLLQMYFDLEARRARVDQNLARKKFIEQCKKTKINEKVTIDEVLLALSKIDGFFDKKNPHGDMVDMIEEIGG